MSTPNSYEAGAKACKNTLVRLVELNRQSHEASGDFDPYALAPVLLAGCLATMGEAEAAGFWEAFAVMLGTELAASEFDPNEWEPVENLAIYEREGEA